MKLPRWCYNSLQSFKADGSRLVFRFTGLRSALLNPGKLVHRGKPFHCGAFVIMFVFDALKCCLSQGQNETAGITQAVLVSLHSLLFNHCFLKKSQNWDPCTYLKTPNVDLFLNMPFRLYIFMITLHIIIYNSTASVAVRSCFLRVPDELLKNSSRLKDNLVYMQEWPKVLKVAQMLFFIHCCFSFSQIYFKYFSLIQWRTACAPKPG